MVNNIVLKIRDFLNKSSSHYSPLTSRKRRDLAIYSGEFWSEAMVDALDRKGRINCSFNHYNKFSNAITSPFSKSPYHLSIEDPDGLYKDIQETVDKWENQNSTKFALITAVRHACVTGTGFIVLSFQNNQIVPEVIRDVSQVALDPFVQDLDAGDSEELAIVNFISLKKAKRLYGDDITDYNGEYYLADMGDQWDVPSDCVPLVHYYKINNDNQVELWKVCGNKVLNENEEPIVIPCDRIPVFRICYNEVVRGGKIDYNGIVDQTADLAKGLNIAYSQLLERANRTPRSNFLMPAKAIDGLEEFYEKMHTKESLVTLYNGDVPPTPIRESFETADLVTTIDGINNLMAQVIGVPVGGIQPAVNETATAILTQQINSESNVNSLYENAYEAIYNMSKTLLSILCWQNDMELPDFKLISGPSVITKKQKTRQDLLAVAQLIPPELQTVVAKSYIETLDNEISEPVLADLIANSPLQFISDKAGEEDPAAVNVLNKMNNVLEQTQMQLEQTAQQLTQLKEENAQLRMQLLSQKESHILDLQKHQDNIELQYAKLNLEKEKVVANTDIKAAEIENKAAADDAKTETEIMKIENQRMSLVNQAVDNMTKEM